MQKCDALCCIYLTCTKLTEMQRIFQVYRLGKRLILLLK